MTNAEPNMMSDQEIEAYRNAVTRLVSSCRELIRGYPLKDRHEPRSGEVAHER
jgi:hypothetical protein